MKANALEYLENILKPQHRRLLVPLLEIEKEIGPVDAMTDVSTVL
jgi:hypothetical protein